MTGKSIENSFFPTYMHYNHGTRFFLFLFMGDRSEGGSLRGGGGGDGRAQDYPN